MAVSRATLSSLVFCSLALLLLLSSCADAVGFQHYFFQFTANDKPLFQGKGLVLEVKESETFDNICDGAFSRLRLALTAKDRGVINEDATMLSDDFQESLEEDGMADNARNGDYVADKKFEIVAIARPVEGKSPEEFFKSVSVRAEGWELQYQDKRTENSLTAKLFSSNIGSLKVADLFHHEPTKSEATLQLVVDFKGLYN